MLEKSGREKVDSTPDGIITHELGHALHYKDFVRNNKELNRKISDSDWSKNAEELSMYSTTNYAEFFAESYAAYMKNERKKVLPELLKYFDSIRK